MGVKVDFSSVDMTQKSFEPMPSGEYVVAITDISMAEVQSGNNQGKPFFKVEATVQEGQFTNRKLWFNVMLFSTQGGAWFLAAFLKACGFEVGAGQLDISDSPEDYIGKTMTVNVSRVRNRYMEEREGSDWDGTPIYKNEVKGFVVNEAAPNKAGSKKKNPLSL